MLSEIAQYAEFADQAGYFGFGHPEHHLQIEGFEISNDPCLMAMWLGSHSKKMKVITCGFVSTANNPTAAEKIATLDHMLGGRFGVGLVRGISSTMGSKTIRFYQELNAVGPWNAKTEADDINREYFAEFVDIVVTALKSETMNYQGKYWSFPPKDFVNPHDHPVYSDYGQGVDANMAISEIGIALSPCKMKFLYGGFSQSLTTAKFWAKYKGRPIVLSGNTDFLELLWKSGVTKRNDTATLWNKANKPAGVGL